MAERKTEKEDGREGGLLVPGGSKEEQGEKTGEKRRSILRYVC